MSERPTIIAEAVRDWDERCDLDFRCPEAGRWPRTWDEYAQWAWKYAHEIVAYLRAPEPTDASDHDAPGPNPTADTFERARVESRNHE